MTKSQMIAMMIVVWAMIAVYETLGLGGVGLFVVLMAVTVWLSD